MTSIRDLKIRAEFREALPALKDEEKAQLRENILADGRIRDPIVYWMHEGTAYIADGHHRYDVWGSAPDMPEPPLWELKRKSVEEVVRWIRQTGLGRRNLNPIQYAEYLGKTYNAAKRDPTENIKKGLVFPKGQNDPSGKSEPADATTTAADIAEDAGVSEKTVKRAGELAEAMDAIRAVNGKAATDIASGAIKLTKKDIIALGGRDRDGIAKALLNIKHGRAWNENGAAAESPARQSSGEPSSPVPTDALDRPVPAHLIEKFEAVPKYRSIVKQIGTVKTEIEELHGAPGGECLDLEECDRALKQAQTALKFSCPHTECPRCQRKPKKSCELCRGCGYIVRATYNRLSDIEKRWLQSN